MFMHIFILNLSKIETKYIFAEAGNQENNYAIVSSIIIFCSVVDIRVSNLIL